MSRAHPHLVLTTHGDQFSAAQIWVGDLMVSDGKTRHFDQKMEDLVTSGVEKLYKCPKIKIMGLAKNGVLI